MDESLSTRKGDYKSYLWEVRTVNNAARPYRARIGIRGKTVASFDCPSMDDAIERIKRTIDGWGS